MSPTEAVVASQHQEKNAQTSFVDFVGPPPRNNSLLCVTTSLYYTMLPVAALSSHTKNMWTRRTQDFWKVLGLLRH